MLYLLLVLFPISIAASTFVLRKNSGLVIFIALGAVLAEMLIAAQIPLDNPSFFLGVTLTLNALNRMFMVLFLAIGGFAFVGAWNLPHGENFVPIGLLLLSQVCGVLLLQNPFISTLLLALSGLTAVLAMVDLPAGTSSLVGTRAIAAALKYMVLMVVAAILMYIAFVLATIFRIGELPGRISLSHFILALLAVSFSLRLALIPFHAWLAVHDQFASDWLEAVAAACRRDDRHGHGQEQGESDRPLTIPAVQRGFRGGGDGLADVHGCLTLQAADCVGRRVRSSCWPV